MPETTTIEPKRILSASVTAKHLRVSRPTFSKDERRGWVSVGPRYRDLRGPIAGEAVVTLATPEYPFRFPVASPTRTR